MPGTIAREAVQPAAAVPLRLQFHRERVARLRRMAEAARVYAPIKSYGPFLTDEQRLVCRNNALARIISEETNRRRAVLDSERRNARRKAIATAFGEEPDDPRLWRTDFERARILMRRVCRLYKVSSQDICCESRTAKIVKPRFALIWLLARFTGYSLPRIGKFIGGRDHTTILHAVRSVSQKRQRPCRGHGP